MKSTLTCCRIRVPAIRRLWLFLPVMLLAAQPALSGPIRITDDLSRPVALTAPAKRIVALYGALNEILAGMGLEDRLVARTEADHEPPSITALPVIGTHMRPNLERVLSVHPDLVLQVAGRGESLAIAEKLASFGVPVAIFRITTFPSLFAAIDRIGRLTGQPAAAQKLADSLRARLAAVAAQQPTGTPPRVLFEARSGRELVAGSTSMVSAVIQAAGGVNAVSEPKKLVRLSDEALLRLAPDVCLTQRGPMNPEARSFADRPQFANLPCVRQGRAFVVDEARYSRPGPRSVEAVEALAKLLWQPPSREARP